MKKKFDIKEATLADLDILVKLRMDFLCELQTMEQSQFEDLTQQTRNYFLRKMQSNELISWFVFEKNIVAANGSLLISEMPPTIQHYGGGIEGYVFNIYTLPEFRNCGIATSLTEHIVMAAKLKKCNRIWLAYSDATAAHVYSKLGFARKNDVMELFLL